MIGLIEHDIARANAVMLLRDAIEGNRRLRAILVSEAASLREAMLDATGPAHVLDAIDSTIARLEAAGRST